ncbi:MAG: hypothetical protein K5892_04400 [Acholeplasmatales bacterium]|nr:hypothetical protein [Acholeplasmatales bacterium]
MKKILCEMCGSENLMKQSGMVICQDCGMRYTVEEIKSKIGSKNNQTVNNTNKLTNYIEMARFAKEAGNYEEAENYCNKILEENPLNYEAWMIKGYATLWQSTMGKSREYEGIQAFIKGIKNAPKDEKDNLIRIASDQISNVSLARIILRAESFEKNLYEDDVNGFINDVHIIIKIIDSFFEETNAFEYFEDYLTPIAKTIVSSVMKSYNEVVIPDYHDCYEDYNYRPNRETWMTFVERSNLCLDLLYLALDLLSDNDDFRIPTYFFIRSVHKEVRFSCSYDYIFKSYGKSWYEADKLDKKTQDSHTIAKCNIEKKLFDLSNELLDEIDEKDSEINDEKTKKQIGTAESIVKVYNSFLKEDYFEIPIEIGNELRKKRQDIIEAISKLKKNKESLGIFKGKEKKIIQENIDRLESELTKIGNRFTKLANDIKEKYTNLVSKAQKKIKYLQSKS